MTDRKLKSVIEAVLIVVTLVVSCVIGYFLVSQRVEVANAITLIGEALRGLR